MLGHRKQVLQTPADAAASAGGGSLEYAGFWARVAALLVDSAILTIFLIVLFVVLGMAMGATGLVIGNIIYFLVYLLYWPVMECSARQATFGKQLLGIRVTDLAGNRASFVKSLLRNLAKILSSIPMGLGFLLAAFTGRKQALHDMITGCLVVRVGPSSFLKAAVAAVGGLAIASYGGYYYVAKVYLPQQMDTAMKGAGKDFQREMERAMKDVGKEMAREMERAMKQAEADMKRQMEQAAKEAQKAAPPPSPPVAQAPAAAPSAPPAPAAKAAAVEVKPAPAAEKPAAAPAKPAAVAVAPAVPAAAPAAADKPQPAQRVARRPLAAPPPEPAVVQPPVRTPRYNDVMTPVMARDRAGAAEAIEVGFWVDRPDSNGVTPLMAAALNGDADMAALLLKHGADPNRSAASGSVLAHAERGGNAKVVALLKKAGAR